jgi:holin-like protein
LTILRDILRLLLGSALLVGCFFAGEWIKTTFGLFVPNNVIGLFIMLALLGTGIVPVSVVEPASKWLLFFLPLLFVPIYVLATKDKALWQHWGHVIVPCMMFAVIIMWILVGHFSQFLNRRAEGDNSESDGVNTANVTGREKTS